MSQTKPIWLYQCRHTGHTRKDSGWSISVSDAMNASKHVECNECPHSNNLILSPLVGISVHMGQVSSAGSFEVQSHLSPLQRIIHRRKQIEHTFFSHYNKLDTP